MGVIIGIILLLVLIGLVVLQGMIEWGGFDTDKLTNFGKTKDEPADKDEKKDVSKPIVKSSGKKQVQRSAKKPVKKAAKKKGAK